MEEKRIDLACDGYRVAGVLATPPDRMRGTVALAPGLTGDMDQRGRFPEVAARLCDLGVASLRFNYVGRGEGADRRDYRVSRCTSAIEAALDALCEIGSIEVPHAIVARGQGVYSALAAGRSRPVTAIVGWGAILDPLEQITGRRGIFGWQIPQPANHRRRSNRWQ